MTPDEARLREIERRITLIEKQVADLEDKLRILLQTVKTNA